MELSKRYQITVDGQTYQVEVGDIGGSVVDVLVDGVEYQVEVPDAPAAASQSPASAPVARREPPRRRPAAPPRPTAASASDIQDVVRAPMPGKIVRVNVANGDSVKQGEAMVVLESMKMENSIASPRDGVVKMVHVAADDSVQHGQTLVELE